MTIPIKLVTESRGFFTLRDWRTATREAWEDAGEHWHRKILPRHFRLEAFQRYGYKRRGRKYTERKQTKFGHRRPLEFSGRMRKKLLRIRDVRGTGNTSKRQGAVKIRLSGPRYLNPFRKNLRQPDMALELRTVDERDARELAKVLDKSIQERIDANTRRRKL